MKDKRKWTKIEKDFIISIVKCVDFSQKTNDQERLIDRISDIMDRGVGGVKMEIDRTRKKLGLIRLYSGDI
jgi:hypothetical protein